MMPGLLVTNADTNMTTSVTLELISNDEKLDTNTMEVQATEEETPKSCEDKDNLPEKEISNTVTENDNNFQQLTTNTLNLDEDIQQNAEEKSEICEAISNTVTENENNFQQLTTNTLDKDIQQNAAEKPEICEATNNTVTESENNFQQLTTDTPNLDKDIKQNAEEKPEICEAIIVTEYENNLQQLTTNTLNLDKDIEQNAEEKPEICETISNTVNENNLQQLSTNTLNLDKDIEQNAEEKSAICEAISNTVTENETHFQQLTTNTLNLDKDIQQNAEEKSEICEAISNTVTENENNLQQLTTNTINLDKDIEQNAAEKPAICEAISNTVTENENNFQQLTTNSLNLDKDIEQNAAEKPEICETISNTITENENNFQQLTTNSLNLDKDIEQNSAEKAEICEVIGNTSTENENNSQQLTTNTLNLDKDIRQNTEAKSEICEAISKTVSENENNLQKLTINTLNLDKDIQQNAEEKPEICETISDTVTENENNLQQLTTNTLNLNKDIQQNLEEKTEICEAISNTVENENNLQQLTTNALNLDQDILQNAEEKSEICKTNSNSVPENDNNFLELTKSTLIQQNSEEKSKTCENNPSKNMSPDLDKYNSPDSNNCILIDDNEDPLKENITQKTVVNSISPNNTIKSDNINNSTNSDNSFTVYSNLNLKKKTKLISFLNKYNLSETDLVTKLKHIKRKTKDKTKLDGVLSHKLNRNYLKTLNYRRSVKNKNIGKLKKNLDTSKDEEYSTCESGDSETETMKKNDLMTVVEATVTPEPTTKIEEKINEIKIREINSQKSVAYADNLAENKTNEDKLQEINETKITNADNIEELRNEIQEIDDKIEKNEKKFKIAMETDEVEVYNNIEENLPEEIKCKADEKLQSFQPDIEENEEYSLNVTKHKVEDLQEDNMKKQDIYSGQTLVTEDTNLQNVKKKKEDTSDSISIQNEDNVSQILSEIEEKETTLHSSLEEVEDVTTEDTNLQNIEKKKEDTSDIISIPNEDNASQILSEIEEKETALHSSLEEVEDLTTEKTNLQNIEKKKEDTSDTISIEDNVSQILPEIEEKENALPSTLVRLEGLTTEDTNLQNGKMKNEDTSDAVSIPIEVNVSQLLQEIEENKNASDSTLEEIEDLTTEGTNLQNAEMKNEDTSDAISIPVEDNVLQEIEENKNATDSTLEEIEDNSLNEIESASTLVGTENTNTDESEDTEGSSVNNEESPGPIDIIPNLYGDDDIRNKIKMQLVLLRRNTRKPPLLLEIEPEQDNEENKLEEPTNTEELIKDDVNQYQNTSTSVSSTNLTDVLLSNESELAIINVVGGYVSDEEIEISKQIVEDEKPAETEPVMQTSCHTNRGISITEKLLMDLSQENLHSIHPTKTADITKIKGWRRKTFTLRNDENIKENPLEYVNEDVNVEDDLPTLIPFTSKQISSSLENPLPGTSSGYFETETPEITTKDSNINNEIISKKINLPDDINNIKSTVLSTEDVLKLPSDDNKKSAFVSDYLETFLSNNTELKISYEVPKLVAEEGITKPESEMPVSNNDYLAVVEKPTIHKSKNVAKKAKPKTLAEKRRMMELDRQKQLLHDMETNESIYLKRLEYCEKRNKTEIAKDVSKNLMMENIPFSRHCWRLATKSNDETRQFAVIDGEKIRIIGSTGGKDLIIPKNRIKSRRHIVSKPSLHKIDEKSILKPCVAYNPGPLSRKYKLVKQKHSSSGETWESCILKMPKIKLEVYPEQNKPLPLIAQQYLQLCRHDQFTINNNWAEFAVTAVKTNVKQKPEKFEFDVPYANGQNRLLVRKVVPLAKVHPGKIEEKFPHSNVDKTIKDIMSDLLQCIENQELDKDIIKEDPDLDFSSVIEKGIDRPLSPIDPLVQAIIKRPNARRSKASLELRRLNVQVIEVDVKEDEKDPDNCSNDYCKLGCVCKSLRGASALIPEHCGRTECMLQCTCSFEALQKGHHSITLPVGTDILSSSTVVRLQDEAKRNLAKEEREFTQTVIKANNQTIMVGGGSRDRARRIHKVPKKYNNFAVDKPTLKGMSPYDKMISDSITEQNVGLIERVATPNNQILESEPENEIRLSETKKVVPPIWSKKEKDPKIEKKLSLENEYTKCTVILTKMQLNNVIPWCMVHNLYKCHCGGKTVSTDSLLPKEKREQVASKQVEKSLNETDKYISYNPRFGARYQAESNPSVPVNDPTEKYCARTKALATNYYHVRNRSQRVKADYALLRAKENETIVDFNNLNQNVGLKNKRKKYESYGTYENQIDYDVQDLLVPMKTKIIRRKPQCRNDFGKVLKKQKRNPTAKSRYSEESSDSQDFTKKSKELAETEKKRLDNTHLVSSQSFIDYDRSYMGLLTPSKEWLKRFHKMLNPIDNAIVHQIRLLEWTTMVQRQGCGALQVWFNTKRYNNIIFTEDRRRPSTCHVNVKLFKNFPLQNYKLPDIISSLLLNKLPGAAQKSSETYIILVYSGTFWEARGTIVLSDTTEICREKLGHKVTPTCILTPGPWPSHQETEQQLAQAQKPTPPEPEQQVAQEPKTGTSSSGNLIIKSTPSMSVEVVNTDVPLPAEKSINNKNTNSGVEIISLMSSSSVKNDKQKSTEKTTTEITKANIRKPDTEDLRNILAPLPTGGVLNRWFMLTLENDFSVLRISFSDFHIKYTHLQAAINMACKSNKTVRIKTLPSKNPNIGETFSIYACPASSQRIFFGPYGNNIDHGLETFRYVNGKLVNTKIYNKMRGSPEKKTAGYWFTHSSTLNNKLNLEPNYDDEISSGSECSTACTTIDNVKKPLIEIVDLTGNDSDSDNDTSVNKKPENESVGALITVLSADFSKKASNDLAIESVNTSTTDDSKVPDVYVNIVNDSSETPKDPLRIERKRKSDSNLSDQPVIKQPTLIDCIELEDDEDEEMPVLEPYNKEQNVMNSPNNQMPPLCPVNYTTNVTTKDKKTKCLYVITNIPGIGYFVIYFEKTKFSRQNMYTIVRGFKAEFETINNAIKYLHYICTKSIYFLPNTLRIKFSIVDSAEPPEMPKFNDEFLNGHYMLSERGIFNILNMNTQDLDRYGFEEDEIRKLLSHKCDLLIERNIKQIGIVLFGGGAAKRMTQDEILRMAPNKIKAMELKETSLLEEKNRTYARQQNLLTLINDHLRNSPEVIKINTQKKVYSIVHPKSKPNLSDIEKNFEYLKTLSSASSVAVNEITPNSTSDETIKLLLSNPPKSQVPDLVNMNPVASVSSSSNQQTRSLLTNPLTGKTVTTLSDSTRNSLFSNPTFTGKTISPLPAGKVCKIIDGKIIVIEKAPSLKIPPKTTSISQSKLQVLSFTKSSNKLIPPPKLQSESKSNKCSDNSNFDFLVPISGLKSPVTVTVSAAVGQNRQNSSNNPTTLLGTKQSVRKSTTLLMNNNLPEKIVDLTDD